MQPGLSTHVFLQHSLQTSLLDAVLRGLAPYASLSGTTPVIEVFAARHHFDYTDRSAVRDLATWFHDTGTQATLHQPIYSEARWSRHVTPTLNLIDPEKSRRIEAMDEVKRALDSAEQIPFTALTLHLGLKDDPWNLRAFENSLTAIEHIKAFAHPLGVKVLLENLENEVTTPEHLLEILTAGHFTNVGIALDLGHAHLASAYTTEEAFELLKPRIVTLNLHDNHGTKDEHLWPVADSPAEKATESVTIDWTAIAQRITAVLAILEISHDLNETPESVTRKTTAFFDHQSRLAEHPNPPRNLTRGTTAGAPPFTASP
jgi:sugar phosphate isomerase/epimerase